VNRRELIRAVATQTGVDSRDVETVLTGLTEVVTAVVAMGEPVSIAGFAKFLKVDRATRPEVDPDSQRPVRTGASGKARITPLKGLRDAVIGATVAPRLEPGVWPAGPSQLPRKGKDPRPKGTEKRVSVGEARRRASTLGQPQRPGESGHARTPGPAESSGRAAVSSGRRRKPRPPRRNGKGPRLVTENRPDQRLRRCSACGRERPAKDFPGQFGGGICDRCRKRAERARDAVRRSTKRRSVWTVSGGGFESNRRRH
jgi:nucleoid DNA-binding protein